MFLMLKNLFYWKYQYNKYIFNFINIYSVIPVSGCVGMGPSALFCPGAYNTVKMVLCLCTLRWKTLNLFFFIIIDSWIQQNIQESSLFYIVIWFCCFWLLHYLVFNFWKLRLRRWMTHINKTLFIIYIWIIKNSMKHFKLK